MNIVERQRPPLAATQETGQCTDVVCGLSQAPVATNEPLGTATALPPASTPSPISGHQGITNVNPEGTTVISPDPERTQRPSFVASQTGSNQAAITGTQETASSSKGGGGGIGGGAVAGVAIACLIVGAGLAFAAAFFFFKRRNKPRDGAVGYNNYSDSSPELVMMQKSAGRNSPYVQVSQTPLPAPMPAPVPAAAPIHQPTDVLASILPAAAHENEVQSRVAALFKQIHRHVDTYYRDVHASITPSMGPELIRFGMKDVNMAELLQDCSNPTTALKHALMAYVLGITGPKKGDEGETLFPDELDSARALNASTDPTLATASTLHRRLSVLLYTSNFNSTTSPRRSWSFQSNMREAAEHFSLTFFPWANPGSDDQEKEDDLTRIISEMLETRVWLFGQPSEFEFRWDGVGSRGVVVSPELVKQDEAGGGRRVVLESGVSGL